MNIIVTGRHVAITDATREQIARKLRPLGRLLNDSVVSLQCVLSRERQQIVCEMTCHARGDHLLHGVGRHVKALPAVAAAMEKIEQQARKLADRWKKRRRGAPRAEPGATDGQVARPKRSGRVVRSNRADVKPMSVDDAVLALSGGSQSFMVFRDAESDTVSILYRRPDGNFGLIEPEV